MFFPADPEKFLPVVALRFFQHQNKKFLQKFPDLRTCWNTKGNQIPARYRQIF